MGESGVQWSHTGKHVDIQDEHGGRAKLFTVESWEKVGRTRDGKRVVATIRRRDEGFAFSLSGTWDQGHNNAKMGAGKFATLAEAKVAAEQLLAVYADAEMVL